MCFPSGDKENQSPDMKKSTAKAARVEQQPLGYMLTTWELSSEDDKDSNDESLRTTGLRSSASKGNLCR